VVVAAGPPAPPSSSDAIGELCDSAASRRVLLVDPLLDAVRRDRVHLVRGRPRMWVGSTSRRVNIWLSIRSWRAGSLSSAARLLLVALRMAAMFVPSRHPSSSSMRRRRSRQMAGGTSVTSGADTLRYLARIFDL